MCEELLICEFCNKAIDKNELYIELKSFNDSSVSVWHEKCYIQSMKKKEPLNATALEIKSFIILDEYIKAKKKFKPFCNLHEAYAVLLEEVDELWDVVKGKDPNRYKLAVEEAIQIGAMALGIVYEFREK